MAKAKKIERKAEQISEIKRCGSDPVYFINKYVKISTTENFVTFPYQDECIESFLKNRFTIVNKSRQLGLSTVSAAYCLWQALFRRDQCIIVIATKLEVAKNFISKVKIMFDSLPAWLVVPVLNAESVKYLKFSNNSQIIAIPTSADAGRSYAITFLVIDEAAHIENFPELWTGLLPTLSATKGKAVLISSPLGVGSLYHQIWQGAVEGTNGFHPIELPWQVRPDRDEAWFQQEIKSANNDMRLIAQEYLCLEKDTNIITDGGCKKIKDIKIGDMVLTHKGRYRKVNNVFSHTMNPEEETLYKVNTPGLRRKNIYITNNHPIYGLAINSKSAFFGTKGKNLNDCLRVAMKDEKNLSFSSIDEIKQKQTKSTKKFYSVLFPEFSKENIKNEFTEIDLASLLPNTILSEDKQLVRYFKQNRDKETKRFIKVDYELGKLVGLFLAEGHTEINRIGFAFHSNEADTLVKFCEEQLRKIGVSFHRNNRDYSECITICSNNKHLRALFRFFINPGDATTKTLNMQNVLATNEEFIKGLITGHFLGDGDHPQNHCLDNKIKVASYNSNLLRQAKTLLSMFGHFPRIGEMYQKETYVEIDGLRALPESRRNIEGLLKINKTVLEKPTSRTRYWENVGFLGKTQFKQVEPLKEFSGNLPELWNISVDEDESYVADNLVVHNCSFSASGYNFLDTESLSWVHETVKTPIAKYGEKMEMDIWEYAEPGSNYIISADVARGDSEDYSAFHVFDARKNKVVADYKGKIQPDAFARFLVDVAQKYNNAFIVHEQNNSGQVTSYELKNLKYPNLYYEKLWNGELSVSYTELETKELLPGFVTSVTSRPKIMGKMDSLIKARSVKVRSARLAKEFQTFIIVGDKPKAQKGQNDDLVMSFAIGCNFLGYDNINTEVDLSPMALILGMSRSLTNLTEYQKQQQKPNQGWGYTGFDLPGRFNTSSPAPVPGQRPDARTNSLNDLYSWLLKP